MHTLSTTSTTPTTSNHFSSRGDALAFLASTPWLERNPNSSRFSSCGSYHTAHGEYERPDYYPVRYQDGWAIRVAYHFYADTVPSRDSGRMSDQRFSELFLDL